MIQGKPATCRHGADHQNPSPARQVRHRGSQKSFGTSPSPLWLSRRRSCPHISPLKQRLSESLGDRIVMPSYDSGELLE
jgi:hypothetical protein